MLLREESTARFPSCSDWGPQWSGLRASAAAVLLREESTARFPSCPDWRPQWSSLRGSHLYFVYECDLYEPKSSAEAGSQDLSLPLRASTVHSQLELKDVGGTWGKERQSLRRTTWKRQPPKRDGSSTPPTSPQSQQSREKHRRKSESVASTKADLKIAFKKLRETTAFHLRA